MCVYIYAAAAKSLHLCPTLCDPIDGSPPGSSVHGILQERTLEWVAISSSNTWKWKVKVKLLSCVWLLATPWTAAYQAPPSMGFSRQEYWSGVSLPSPQMILEYLKADNHGNSAEWQPDLWKHWTDFSCLLIMEVMACYIIQSLGILCNIEFPLRVPIPNWGFLIRQLEIEE